MSKSLAKNLSGSLSFVGSIAKRLGRAFSSALSFVAVLLKGVNGSLAWTEEDDVCVVAAVATVTAEAAWIEADDYWTVSVRFAVTGAHPQRRIHPRWIREEDPPEVKKTKRKSKKLSEIHEIQEGVSARIGFEEWDITHIRLEVYDEDEDFLVLLI